MTREGEKQFPIWRKAGYMSWWEYEKADIGSPLIYIFLWGSLGFLILGVILWLRVALL